LHNGMLQVQEAKMAKSTKNFFTVRQVLEKHTKEEIRFYLLNTHYRGPLAYSEAALDEAASSLKRLHNTYFELKNAAKTAVGSEDAQKMVAAAKEEFIVQMDDDFNSRAAIAALFDLVRDANRLLAESKLSTKGVMNLVAFLEEADGVLGILPKEEGGEEALGDVMSILIELRKELRKRKQFDLADRIRDQLAEKGIKLEDTSEGAKWKRV